MSNASLQQLFESLTQGLPTFDDGRIDYTDAAKAPVVSIVVYHNGEILLLKRSDKVGAYPGAWNGVSGYIDEPKSVEAFALQELAEELGLKPEGIKRLAFAEPYELKDSNDREWVIFPALAVLSERPSIQLDWEHTEFVWIDPEHLLDYDSVSGFDLTLARAMQLYAS